MQGMSCGCEKAMFATLKKPARKWRAEITRRSADSSCWSQHLQLADQRSVVAMGEPRLGEGAVCNTEETCTQLVDRNHSIERRRKWLVAILQVKLAG